MMDVPKIVVGRLRGTSNPGNHPDTDLLAAFVEQALAKRERLHMLEHLAQCSECREIVSLAQPEIPEPQTSLKLFSLRSPILRWGALAACVVVVGAVVTTRHLAQKNVETRVTAKAPFSDTKDASQGFDLKTDLTAKLQPQPLAKQDLVVPHGLAKQRRGAALNSRAPAVNAEKGGTGKKGPLAAAETASAVPGPTQLSKATDQEQQKKITYDSLGSATKIGNEAVMNETEATSASVEVADARPGKAKDAHDSRMKAPMATGSGIGRTVAPMTANRMTESRAELNRAVDLTQRWNLSSEGMLQRSFDAGRTWQTVPVADNAIFRAVSAVGPEIWVGGNGGSLYHSSDSGQHWTQVKPAVNGSPLIADIVGIEFADAQHGKLTTSNRETWTTSDAGQSWTREK
jgi:hypothetical protein